MAMYYTDKTELWSWWRTEDNCLPVWSWWGAEEEQEDGVNVSLEGSREWGGERSREGEVKVSIVGFRQKLQKTQILPQVKGFKNIVQSKEHDKNIYSWLQVTGVTDQYWLSVHALLHSAAVFLQGCLKEFHQIIWCVVYFTKVWLWAILVAFEDHQ